MDSIMQWVTQIVIFIMLATIIDLLIPNNSMKKYVKFVLGLTLVLIFLTPLFNIYQYDITKALETGFHDIFSRGDKGENMENLIEMQKSEIESAQNAYILEQ